MAPTSLPGLIGVMATMVVVIAAAGMFGKTNHEAVPIDQVQLARVNETIGRCSKNGRDCIGGYIRSKKTKTLSRIEVCGNGCRRWEIDVNDLGLIPGAIDYIVLPEDRTWEAVAVLYARQFVQAEKRL